MSPFDLLLLTLETIFFINNENSTAEVDSITKYIYTYYLFLLHCLRGTFFLIIKGNMFFVCLLVCLFVICFCGAKGIGCLLFVCFCRLCVNLIVYLFPLIFPCLSLFLRDQSKTLAAFSLVLDVCLYIFSASLYVFVFAINQRHRSPSLLSS